MRNRRVVVSGVGVVSSLGIGVPDFWDNLLKGQTGISRIKNFDTEEYRVHWGGEVCGFLGDVLLPREASFGRSSSYMLAAIMEAAKDADIEIPLEKSIRCGICVGTTMGEPQVLESAHLQLRTVARFPGKAMKCYPANNIASSVAIALGVQRQSLVIANACAAGNFALGYAADLIRRGDLDCAFVGGVDSLSRVAFSGFNRLLAMSENVCRPFDKSRQGMLLGEGAGGIFLESYDSAKARSVKVYAEVSGYGISADASHMTTPDPRGISKAMRKAISAAGIAATDVDYVNAHGTGTVENDRIECAALRDVFGRVLSHVAVSSAKSMLGHTMGAASAIESIICCLAIRHSAIPPTINYVTPDPECAIDCVPNVARKSKVRVALNNSLAFGGNNCCVVFKEA